VLRAQSIGLRDKGVELYFNLEFGIYDI